MVSITGDGSPWNPYVVEYAAGCQPDSEEIRTLGGSVVAVVTEPVTLEMDENNTGEWRPPHPDVDQSPETTAAIIRIDLELARHRQAMAEIERVTRCLMCGEPGIHAHLKEGSR
jgi:hypothetical protein